MSSRFEKAIDAFAAMDIGDAEDPRETLALAQQDILRVSVGVRAVVRRASGSRGGAVPGRTGVGGRAACGGYRGFGRAGRGHPPLASGAALSRVDPRLCRRLQRDRRLRHDDGGDLPGRRGVRPARARGYRSRPGIGPIAWLRHLTGLGSRRSTGRLSASTSCPGGTGPLRDRDAIG